MFLNDFSGGLNSRVDPSLLQATQAQKYINLDNTRGPLLPINAAILDTEAVDKYFTWYYGGEEFVSSTTESSFVEYQEVLYATNLNSHPTKYDGTNKYRLGIIAPTLLVSLSTATTGVLEGTYTYAYTYYNSETGIESAPNTVSAELAVSLKAILVSGFVASIDPQVDKIRLYRLGGTLTEYTLVVEKANDSTNHEDNVPDLALAGNHILDSYFNIEAKDGLKYIFEAYSVLFGAVGDKLYYSNIGKPDTWPATNYIDFPSAVTGIALIQSGLIVFTKFQAFLVTGTSPTTFSKSLLDAEQGCLSHYTIQFTNNNLVWLSSDGICATTGGMIEVISLPLLGKLSLTGLGNAQVLNRVYYIVHDGGILALDSRYNLVARTLDSKVGWLHMYDDNLYANIESTVYKMFSGDPLEYHYRSPVLTEGSFSNLKTYKDFYIRYKGKIDLTVYLDGKEVNYKELDGDSTYNLKALSGATGYGLEFDIKGTGIVYEIEYKAQGRTNGK